MKRFISLSLLGLGLAACFLFLSWDSPQKTTTDTYKPNPLEGTWKLLASGWNADTKKFADKAIFKIYTRDRYATVIFDASTGEFAGAGGGTYTVKGNQFTEQLEYFSFDPAAAGTQQTFSFNILDGDMLHQSGKLNTEKYPDYDIQEFYQRVEPGMSDSKKHHPLVGVWNIEEATYGDNRPDIKEKYGKVIKIITPEYFYGAFFNPETQYFNGVTFGTWVAEGEQYTETILTYSWDNSIVREPQSFTWKVENDRFYQTGFIDSDKYKNYRIEEVSSRME